MINATTLLVLPILLFACGTTIAACNTNAGKRVFNKCQACHSMDPAVQLMGPTLHGIAGREAGTHPEFVYSAAMAKSRVVWNAATMARFLESPMTYMPGTSMPFAGIKRPDQRDALNCYLGLNAE